MKYCDVCGAELVDGERHRCVKPRPVTLGASEGLGDTIAKVTKAFGIKPCGRCKKRQQKLNEIFPYKDNNNGE